MEKHIVIIGAGPAGLTAGYILAQNNIKVTLLEADSTYVGGIARTIKYNNYYIDIGGHRFFSKVDEIEKLWDEILPQDMLNRPRLSRILYAKKYFTYPLRFAETFYKLGFLETLRCCFSYIYAKLSPIRPSISFSDWVTNRFGKRLFNIFFKSYTEKVWGMPCETISADWAARRIKDLSLFSLVLNAFIPKFYLKKRKTGIKTLIETFRYPRKGAGMLWESCAKKIEQKDGEIWLDSKVFKIHFDREINKWHIHYIKSDGSILEVDATHIISTAALRDLVVDFLSAQLPDPVSRAAQQLQYRDFIVVALILKDKEAFRDNWIYVHSNEVQVARIQNYKSWSPEMVPEQDMTCYGMEYFCSKNDTLWSRSDAELIAQAKSEIVHLGLAASEDIIDHCVIRQPKAYPVYDHHYQKHVAKIRQEIETNFPTLHVVGRNGMHMYNNQDHSMMTAILAVKNILAGHRLYDVWEVNQDAEYIETAKESKSFPELRDVPRSL